MRLRAKHQHLIGYGSLIADIQFLPISGLLGYNMKTRLDKSVCPWWNGPCVFEALDTIEVPPRDPKGPFRYEILHLSGYLCADVF